MCECHQPCAWPFGNDEQAAIKWLFHQEYRNNFTKSAWHKHTSRFIIIIIISFLLCVFHSAIFCNKRQSICLNIYFVQHIMCNSWSFTWNRVLQTVLINLMHVFIIHFPRENRYSNKIWAFCYDIRWNLSKAFSAEYLTHFKWWFANQGDFLTLKIYFHRELRPQFKRYLKNAVFCIEFLKNRDNNITCLQDRKNMKLTKIRTKCKRFP